MVHYYLFDEILYIRVYYRCFTQKKKKYIYIYIDEFFFFFWKELDRESHFYM